MQHSLDLAAANLALRLGLITAEQLTAAEYRTRDEPATSILAALVESNRLSAADLEPLRHLAARRLAASSDELGVSRRDSSPQVSAAPTSADDPASERTIGYDVPCEAGPQLQTSDPVGRYRLKSLHAVGGIGEIWLARDADLDRDVAVKRLSTSGVTSEVVRRRFLREARLTARLDHPGIVPIYELCFEANGRPFYAMRFLKGRTLTQAVRAVHRKHPNTGVSSDLLALLNALTTVCQSVAYAHSKGILHRDLKCENVMLGDFGEVIVIDWGLAKEIGDAPLDAAHPPADSDDPDSTDPLQTVAGHILGSPAYMAPEQAAGESELVGPATDVYGLCAILYEILTGRPPFSGGSTIEVLQHVRQDPPIEPSTLVPGLPEELERICLKGLAKRPADRHESAERLAAALQGWLGELAERRRAEDDRERFFELSHDLLAIVADDGSLRQLSPVWSRLLHYDRAALASRNFLDLIDPADRPLLAEVFARPIEHRSVAGLEARIVAGDGETRWISWNVTPIPKDRCHYVVGRDVAELKQSQQLFEGVLQSSPDAMVIVDGRGTIVMVSRQTENVFGYAAQEMIGRPVEMLIPEEVRDRHPRYVAEFFAQAAVRPMGGAMPLSGVRKDGSRFRADVALSPIRLDREILVAASVRVMDR